MPACQGSRTSGQLGALAMSARPQSFSDLDSLFFLSETPSQPLHVLATLVLDRSGIPGTNAYELFQERVVERYRLIEPLRRSPTRSLLGQRFWYDDPEIHIQRHLHHIVVDGGGLEALAEAAGEIASHRLPKDRPLWEAWLVEGFDDRQFAVVAKIHHSVADGVSGIFALAGFFDLEPSPASHALPTPPAPEQVDTPQVLATALGSLLRRPRSFVLGLQRATTSAAQFVASRSATTPLPCTGPRMSYNGALTPRRSVAFSRLPLDDVKQIAREFSASVNDVVVALCAGVLRRHALQSKEVPERPLVAAIPVSERKPEHGATGNHLSFMFYALPVHLPTARGRLEFVKQSAADAKAVYGKAGDGLLDAVATLSPKFAITPAMRAMSSVRAANVLPPVANVLISSIAGPDLPLYVGGARLESIFPMGPVLEGIGLGITAVSFSGTLAFGFIACADLIEDIGELSLGLSLEMAALEDCLAHRADDTQELDPPSES
jgi:WS/DGAT/MGAT family acyltransferase